MGLATYTYNRSTSGGEIITHLINSTDGQGVDFANGALLQLAYAAGGVFGTSDFSIEFIIDQSSANTNDKIIYTSGGGNEFQITSETGSSKIELTFDGADYDFSYDMSADYGSPVHYVMTFDRDDVATLYKDGNSVATVDISGSSAVDLDSSGTAAGYLGGVSDYGVTGVFYRWRTWKKLLSAAEVTACYENASVPITDQWSNCVTDLDFAFANPEMSLQIRSRSGAGDATASVGISQITPIEQVNTNKLSVGGVTPLVGIGLAAGSTPTVPLDIKADASNGGIRLEEDAGGGSNTVAAISQRQSAGSRGGKLVLSDEGVAKVTLEAIGDSSFMGGNVGVGASSPGRLLELENATNPALRLNNGNSVADIGVASSAGAILTGAADDDLVIARNGAYGIAVGTNGATRLTIDSAGNVGIGITPTEL
ncbi:MAG: LamG domain-containing protein, partial [Planctomycetaceae bacterium]|nr:LamG domain-containing protein [Planctomycetaceae bacterium]